MTKKEAYNRYPKSRFQYQSNDATHADFSEGDIVRFWYPYSTSHVPCVVTGTRDTVVLVTRLTDGVAMKFYFHNAQKFV